MLHLHSQMYRLNPATPKYKEFLGATHSIFHVTIYCMSIEQSTCESFGKTTQERKIENIGEYDLFQFLRNKINPQNIMNLKLHSNFDIILEKK